MTALTNKALSRTWVICIGSLWLSSILSGQAAAAAAAAVALGTQTNSDCSNNNNNNNNKDIVDDDSTSSSSSSSSSSTPLHPSNWTLAKARQRAHHRVQRNEQLSTKRHLLQIPDFLPGVSIPKYVTDLVIPPVLHDDHGVDGAVFEISVRQFEQQMLPDGYPKTPVWGFGNPQNANSFYHPSFTVEVTQNKKTNVIWRNELVVDPVACADSGYSADNTACYHLPHLLQDKFGTPVIDASLHWAAPNRKCKDGTNRTDCEGLDTTPYFGPVPFVPHVHGSHVESRSDGYPESWFLPKASNIPHGFATEGSYFRSRFLPSANVPDDNTTFYTNVLKGDEYFRNATDAARGQGYTVYRYTNDQETTALWYHDHTLGMTRLNVYAAGAGFWMIRTPTDGEARLAAVDAKGKKQVLPGPPVKRGQDPNGSFKIRKNIREIPLAIQDKSFYNDGRLFYPANRVYFDYRTCDDGTDSNSDSNGFPYKPYSDVSQLWNPEAFFDATLVNGRTYPKLNVAPERYRFRVLNACDSRTLNLHFHIGAGNGTEIPFYVIGSDQGFLPQVVKIRIGFSTPITPGVPVVNETPSFNALAALLMGPSERYDIIVDFAGLANGTEVFLSNTGPDYPYGGFDEEGFVPADSDSVGQVMKFIVVNSMRKSRRDTSTSPYNMVLNGPPLVPAPTNTTVRDLSIFELDSLFCVQPYDPTSARPCDIKVTDCANGDTDILTGYSSLSYGPIQSRLGIDGHKGPGKLTAQRWMDPISQTPKLGATEIWEIWDWTVDGHPIHVHLVHFHIVGRYDMAGNLLSAPYPYETGPKDTVVVLPGQVTRIQMTFDIAGLYVWHCHILSHEDNEMMRPICVGDAGVDCPASLF